MIFYTMLILLSFNKGEYMTEDFKQKNDSGFGQLFLDGLDCDENIEAVQRLEKKEKEQAIIKQKPTKIMNLIMRKTKKNGR